MQNTKTISGRSSIQGIIDELAHVETSQKGKIMKAGSAIFYAPELAAGLVEDAAAVSILTDLYDGKTNFTHRLRHMPKFKIDKIVFSALMASNEHMLTSVFDQRATYGGLLGRTFLIIPGETREPNSLRHFKKDESLHKRALDKLQMISQLAGEFIFEEDAGELYDDWYKPFYKNVVAKGDKGGVTGRIHTGVKKMAMLFAADELKLELGVRHVQRAIDVCTVLIPSYNKLLMMGGKSTVSDTATTIMLELFAASCHTLTREQLLANNWTNFDSEIMDKCILTLEGGGLIETLIYTGKLSYKLTGKCVGILTNKGEVGKGEGSK